MPTLTPAPVGTPGAVVASAATVVTPTTLTPATGSGYAIGDTLLCFTACRSATPTVATPAGWTSILNVTGTNGRLVLFAKVAASTSEAAPSVVWSGLTTGASGTPVAAVVAAFANLNDAVLASMADVVGTVANGAASTATAAGGTGITTLADNDLVLSLTTRLDDAFTTFTAPAGFTNVTAAFGTTSGLDFAIGWAYQVKTPAGAVTAPNFGLTGATSFASSGAMVALKALVTIVNSDSPSGTINLTGSVVESYVKLIITSDTPSGTINLSGSRVESYSPPIIRTDTPSGTINLSGSCVDAFVPSMVPYSTLILATTGLVSYWRLGEASGNALDSKDSNPGTTIVGGITRGVTGLLTGDANKAAQGDAAVGSYIEAPYSANMDVGAQLTLEFWCKPTSMPAGTSYPVGRKQNVTNMWYVRNYGGTDGRWEFNVYDTANVRTSITSPGAAGDKAAVGQVQHIVMTYDAAGTMKAYVNGVSVSSQSRVPNANIRNDATQGFRLFDGRGVAGTPGFPGVIDDVAFYNVVLTPAQILDHYTNGTTVRPTSYSDTCSGTISLSGTATESWSRTGVDSPSGTISVAGSIVEFKTSADSRSGTITLSGAVAESWSVVSANPIMMVV